MNAAERFLDTNVLLYLLSGNSTIANRAEAELLAGGVVSVQALNEFASVATKKLRMEIPDVKEVLATIRSLCSIEAVDEQTHDRGLLVAERYRLSIFDSMMIASALIKGCKLFISGDLQDGQRIDDQLLIQNPFR
jgi:predicted nucleic acid-binding protein